MVAPNDWLADPIDIEYLRSNLPNIVDDYEVASCKIFYLVIDIFLVKIIIVTIIRESCRFFMGH